MSIPDYDVLRAAVENEESILGLIGEAMCHPDYDALRAAVENEESILGLLNGAAQNRGTQSEEENRGWVTINGRHVLLRDKGAAGGGGAKSGLTKGSKSVRLDSNGIPFEYPTVELPYKEYKNVTDEIGMCWHSKYQGKAFCRIVFTDKTYYFENHGIGDYNIYRVTED